MLVSVLVLKAFCMSNVVMDAFEDIWIGVFRIAFGAKQKKLGGKRSESKQLVIH